MDDLFDYRDVSSISENICCGICLTVLSEPVRFAGCGALFCRDCINQYIAHALLNNDRGMVQHRLSAEVIHALHNRNHETDRDNNHDFEVIKKVNSNGDLKRCVTGVRCPHCNKNRPRPQSLRRPYDTALLNLLDEITVVCNGENCLWKGPREAFAAHACKDNKHRTKINCRRKDLDISTASTARKEEQDENCGTRVQHEDATGDSTLDKIEPLGRTASEGKEEETQESHIVLDFIDDTDNTMQEEPEEEEEGIGSWLWKGAVAATAVGFGLFVAYQFGAESERKKSEEEKVRRNGRA